MRQTLPVKIISPGSPRERGEVNRPTNNHPTGASVRKSAAASTRSGCESSPASNRAVALDPTLGGLLKRELDPGSVAKVRGNLKQAGTRLRGGSRVRGTQASGRVSPQVAQSGQQSFGDGGSKGAGGSFLSQLWLGNKGSHYEITKGDQNDVLGARGNRQQGECGSMHGSGGLGFDTLSRSSVRRSLKDTFESSLSRK